MWMEYRFTVRLHVIVIAIIANVKFVSFNFNIESLFDSLCGLIKNETIRNTSQSSTIYRHWYEETVHVVVIFNVSI